jgi:hypothetical protein
MQRIRELEAWSTPGNLLPTDYGKDLAQELWSFGISPDIYLGLNSIPDWTDIENLRLALASNELTIEDFSKFCSIHSLPPSPRHADSANKFLEYSLGRRLAWIHLPEDSTPDMLQGLIEVLKGKGHVVVDPDTLMVVN